MRSPDRSERAPVMVNHGTGAPLLQCFKSQCALTPSTGLCANVRPGCQRLQRRRKSTDSPGGIGTLWTLCGGEKGRSWKGPENVMYYVGLKLYSQRILASIASAFLHIKLTIYY